MTEWHDEFFKGLYTKVLANQFDSAHSAEEAGLVKRLLKLRKGAHVLDVPCGMGRLTIPLARKGLTMTGVDLREKYLKRARNLARQEGLEVTFLQGDMRKIDFCSAFNGVFNWFGSFGYFSDAENLDLCRRMRQALKPGGRLLIEGMNKSWLLRYLRPQIHQVIGGVSIDTRSCFNHTTQRLHTTWTFRRGAVKERHRVSIRVYNGTEMRALLRAAGFREIELLGNQPLGRFTRHSPRLLAIARRSTRRE